MVLSLHRLSVTMDYLQKLCNSFSG
jgi:hypothetical protein